MAISCFQGLRLAHAVQRVLVEDDAQDVVEYGLLIATIAIIVLLATTAFGTQIQIWFTGLTGRITTT